MLREYFELQKRDSSVKQEAVAGLTTFLTMSYILFVNPSILANAGMDAGAVFVATCLAAAIGSIIMGAYANFPIALAPGMGLNAYFTYGVVIGMDIAWQTALGAVFASGILFIVLSILPIRQWIVDAIPQDLKLAIAAGIGLFLIIIGLTNTGIIVDNPATLVGVGDLTSMPALLAIGCFLLIAVLEARKIPGAIIIAMIAITVLGALLGATNFEAGIASMPPSLAPTFLQLDISKVFELSLIVVVISFLFVDMFDTSGTLVGVSQGAGFLDKDGSVKGMKRAFMADSVATVVGAGIGTSSTTSFVESLSGVRAGGRTGLTAITVGILFLLCLFLSPLASAVQSFATGPALIYVGCMMMKSLIDVDWEDLTSFVPAVVTAICTPLSYSIATGIGFGFITYTVLKLLTGKTSQLNVGLVTVTMLFVAKFAFLS